MDPLSITASIITIIGVGGSIAKTLRNLASYKDAPDFILLLNNELADLHLVVQAIHEIYRMQRIDGQGRGLQDDPIDNSITNTLNQAQQTATDLQRVYDRVSTSSRQSGVAQLKTKTWLLEPRNAKKVHEDLRNTRLKLTVVFGILNS